LKSTAKVVDIVPQLQNHKPNPAWSFELDHVHPWAYWEQAFTPEECQSIIELGNSYIQRQATTMGNNTDKVRKSEVSWLNPSAETEWIYRRVTDIVMSLNERFFKFDLFGALEGFQFTKYTAPGGKYGRHIDSSSGNLVRKLSVTLQLSDPKDYTGGDLCLYLGEKPEVMRKEQGFVALFPSYTLHEVKPVTKGTRYSLVVWITGKPFK
jgi:PKHD-type hydroxylase